MAELGTASPKPAGEEASVASKVQSFTQRQHMIKPTYEIFHYRDFYVNEVALHTMIFMKCIFSCREMWITSLKAGITMSCPVTFC